MYINNLVALIELTLLLITLGIFTAYWIKVSSALGDLRAENITIFINRKRVIILSSLVSAVALGLYSLEVIYEFQELFLEEELLTTVKNYIPIFTYVILSIILLYLYYQERFGRNRDAKKTQEIIYLFLLFLIIIKYITFFISETLIKS